MKKIILSLILLVFSFELISCTNNKEEILKVGMDLHYSPFESRDNKNSTEGISVNIALAFGKFLDQKVEIVAMDFGNLIISLQNGTIDVVIGSMSITEEPKQSVDFSDPYFFFKIISLINKKFALENNLTEDPTVEELLKIEDAKYIGLAS